MPSTTGGFLAAGNTIVQAIVPIDGATGANAGDWVSLKNYGRAVIVLSFDAGTAGEDPVISVLQATANDGTGSKALNTEVVYHKVGAQASTTDFTKVTQTAAATYTHTDGGENQNLFVIEVIPEQLDVANGFDWLSVSVADTGTTAGKFISGIYLMLDPRHGVEGGVACQ